MAERGGAQAEVGAQHGESAAQSKVPGLCGFLPVEIGLAGSRGVGGEFDSGTELAGERVELPASVVAEGDGGRRSRGIGSILFPEVCGKFVEFGEAFQGWIGFDSRCEGGTDGG